MSENVLQEVADDGLGDVKINPVVGVAAIALNMAMKYHDINTVQDGQLYQQYKLEGRNLRELSLNMVFETAIEIERHLLASSDRVAQVIADALVAGAMSDA